MITSIRTPEKSENRKWHKTIEDGITVFWIPVRYSNNMSFFKRIMAFLKFAALASIKAALMECDVVFATSTPLTIVIPAVLASKKSRKPMVFEVRDLWPELPIAIGALKNPIAIRLARALERFAYRNASQIVALSPGMKTGVASTGYPEGKITVIPNACDINLFQVDKEAGYSLRHKYSWLKDRPLVLYTGTFGLINGVDYMARLAAATSAIDPEIRFVAIGSGGQENAIREAAEDLGVLNRNFFMLPPEKKSDMPAWYSAANIACSLVVDIEEMWNNSANKFFDSLASGTPVAINYCGWQARIINENSCGLVLAPKVTSATASDLVAKIKNKQWLAHSGEAALKVAKEQFDRDKLAIELEEVLHKACGLRCKNPNR